MYLTKSNDLDKLECNLIDAGGVNHFVNLTHAQAEETTEKCVKGEAFDKLIYKLFNEWPITGSIRREIKRLLVSLQTTIQEGKKQLINSVLEMNSKYGPRRCIKETSYGPKSSA